MSAKVKEALFELIKSLTKSEKRYFKLLSSRHTIGEENNYVKLFDYLDALDEYDEERIFTEFKGEAFLNRFSITKKRLYDHVIAALDAFHATSSIDAQIFQSIHAADILFEKTLYDHSGRMLRSAEKLAIKQQRYTLLPEIRRKQKKLIENKGYAESKEEELKEIISRDKEIVELISTYDQLWYLKSELFIMLSRKGKARSVEERGAYETLMAQIPGTFSQKEWPFDMRYLYHHIQSAYWFAVGQPSESYHWLKQNHLLFSHQEEHVARNLNNYISLLTNLIHVSDKLGNLKDSSEYLRELKQLPQRFRFDHNEDMQVKLFASTASIELSLFTHRGEFPEAAAQIPFIERGLQLFGDHISPLRRAFIRFKMATVFLATDDLSSALKNINAILNDPDIDESEDILSFTHILDLLVHLEMKHDQLLPYALKSTQRYLKTRNRMYGFEKVFLQFIGKRIKCLNRFDAELLWHDLSDELKGLKNDPSEITVQEYFDFAGWAESKVRKSPFPEVVREKFRNDLKKAS